ncbi:hypothetical protein MED121_14484 [Marinomonas sp. MED121]|uniref:hypothetical protein n=1 Tax=Marinomonas sp. MED121 TaxID=314277 RepID=UPI0000690F83|nr:hypothetical protein [Marinomonas sp. MED121]EAQ67142.1 hypothetical protein MED121_14484 [Marinomonas sp. MED121]
MPLNELIEDKISQYAQALASGHTKKQEHALGEIGFYLALARIKAKKATAEDIGLFDAINDTLQLQGLIANHQTFYK